MATRPAKTERSLSKFAYLYSVTTDVFAPTFEDIRNYVIDYHKRKWTYKQIAQELHLSFGTISKILKSEFGSIEDVLEKKSVKISDESEAYRLFDKNKSLVQVKVELDIPSNEVAEYHKSYQELRFKGEFNGAYDSVKGNIAPFLRLFTLMNRLSMTPEQVAELVKYGDNLPHLQSIHTKMNNQIQDMASRHCYLDSQLQKTAQELQQYKSWLDSYKNGCEQKRKEIESLGSEINRKKRVIRMLDNNKGYNRIKEAAKKEIEIVLQDNRELLANVVSVVLETIRRYPANQQLIFELLNSGSTASSQQGFTEFHRTQFLQLSQHIHSEIMEEITRKTMSNIRARNDESQISQMT